MKPLLLLPALAAGLLPACQPPGPPAATTGAPAAPAARSAPLRRWIPTRHLPPARPGDSLTAEARTLLDLYNLAPLWANAEPAADSARDQPSDHAMEGFYGPDHYRISVYFDEVLRDGRRPERFLVSGRNRYRGVITPFAGTLTVRGVFYARPAALPASPAADTVACYAVRATYELREDPATRGAGVYRGEALLDAEKAASSYTLRLSSLGNTGYHPTDHHGGLTFRGTWTDNKTGRRRAAAWANDLADVVPLPVLQEQQAGGRVGDVDPALAKRGWNEFWENEEWWAAPGPAATAQP